MTIVLVAAMMAASQPALAQGTGEAASVSVRMNVSVPVTFSELEWVFQNPSLSGPSGPVAPDPREDSCPPGRFTVAHDGEWFRFREGGDENACGEARATLPIHPGAQEADIRFHADRSILEANDLIGVKAHMEQSLRLYAGDGVVVAEVPYYDPLAPPALAGRVFTVPATNLVSGPNATLTFGWWFRDGGLSLSDDVLAPLVSQEFSAAVRDATVEYRGIPVPSSVRVDHRFGLDREDARERLTVDAFVAPPEVGNARRSLSLEISNAWSVESVRDPAGRFVPADQLEVREDGGRLTLDLTPSVVASGGEGTYTVHFAAPRSLEAAFWLTPVAVAALASPALAVGGAMRNADVVKRRATGGIEPVLTQARWTLWVLMGVYAAFLVAVTLTPLWTAMRILPLPEEGIVLYAVLLALTAGFIGVALLLRRRLHRSLEEDLERQRAVERRLRSSNQELERFAYVASHDLREPLRTVTASISMLEHRYGNRLDDEAKRLLEFASRSGHDMSAMIEDLLAYSRLDAERQPAVAVAIRAAVAQALERLGDAISRTNAQVQVDIVEASVVADEAQLGRVIQNLLANAVKFSNSSTPKVEVVATPAGGADGRPGRGWCRLAIIDHGPGIPSEYRQRVFDMFRRLQTREESDGTGLGLAVCKKIVEGHGGQIGIESTPGGGTTVWSTWREAA